MARTRTQSVAAKSLRAYITTILAMGGAAFAYSRVHIDPHFPDECANRIERAEGKWIRSYCETRRGDALFVAFALGRVAGLLAALKVDVERRPAVVIDLIAADASARGSRVARAIAGRFRRHFRDQADVLRVGIQVTTAAFQSLYQSRGFTTVEAAYVLHAHRQNGAFL